MNYHIFAESIEQTALDQFMLAMEQDFVVKGALMPDAHMGYTLPIGAVVACEDVVVPSYVGYDIGCGMGAVKTKFLRDDVEVNRKVIFERIYETVKMGFVVHQDPKESFLDTSRLSEVGRDAFERRRGFRALGTLGGGSHFIEIGYDENNAVWIVVHSGSRGPGHGIATEYMRMASPTGKASEGHFPLPVDSDEGKNYINDLNWMLEFALENRSRLLKQVMDIVSRVLFKAADFPSIINRNHNHAELVDGLWIHRKGATHAEEQMMGVIPGNMRDGSFIVRGKGNPDSLCSSSHGAGRVLGRKQAKETLYLEAFQASMAGVTAKVTADTLDESPMAYKDIFEVMRMQDELVDIVHHVKPIINIKS